MDTFEFDYSMKNIPVGSTERYKYRLIEEIEKGLKRMRWKAIFKDEDDAKLAKLAKETKTKNENRKKIDKEPINEYRRIYKTRLCPNQPKGMAEFEKDVYKMIRNIKFRKTTSNFQAKLKNDISRIK